MRLPLFIALRYLRAKKRHRALSVNTVISVIGVMCGVAALIATLAVMTGAMEEIRDKILGTNSHVVINHRGEGFDNYAQVTEQVIATPGVVAATPFIYGQAMLTSEFGVQGVVLRGIDPNNESAVTEVADNLVIGSLAALNEGASPGFDPEVTVLLDEDELPPSQPGIILGRELSLSLGAMVGSSVNVVSPGGEIGPMGMIPTIRPFTVVGIFDTGMFEYDSSLAYLSISAAQAFLQLGDTVTGIEVRTDHFDAAPQVANALRDTLSADFSVRDWQQLNRNFFSALALEKAVMSLILTLIIVVAAFNIVGTLAMLVMEKGREIAILKALGATRRDIVAVFTLIGLLIGGVGTALGFPLGLGICWIIQNSYELPGDVYYISRIPIHLVWSDALAVCGAALAISLIAAIYPAWQAARSTPVEGLRYE